MSNTALNILRKQSLIEGNGSIKPVNQRIGFSRKTSAPKLRHNFPPAVY